MAAYCNGVHSHHGVGKYRLYPSWAYSFGAAVILMLMIAYPTMEGGGVHIRMQTPHVSIESARHDRHATNNMAVQGRGHTTTAP